MADFVLSGRIVDLVLAMVALEAMLLIGLRVALGAGPSVPSSVVTILSGVFLLLALREALSGGVWFAISLPLIGALVAHLADLRLRWSAGAGRPAARSLAVIPHRAAAPSKDRPDA